MWRWRTAVVFVLLLWLAAISCIINLYNSTAFARAADGAKIWAVGATGNDGDAMAATAETGGQVRTSTMKARIFGKTWEGKDIDAEACGEVDEEKKKGGTESGRRIRMRRGGAEDEGGKERKRRRRRRKLVVIDEVGGAEEEMGGTKKGGGAAGGPGSKPPLCVSKCGSCHPCTPIRVPVRPPTNHNNNNNNSPNASSSSSDYYPEAWRCKCGGKLFIP